MCFGNEAEAVPQVFSLSTKLILSRENLRTTGALNASSKRLTPFFPPSKFLCITNPSAFQDTAVNADA